MRLRFNIASRLVFFILFIMPALSLFNHSLVWAADAPDPIIASSSQSSQTLYDFTTPKLQERYHSLIKELRCPKCQNQNIADSDAIIAKDMRYRVRLMLEQEQSDADIKHFLVARYGDFILYNPPFKWQTLLLWLGPGVFLLLGAGLIYRSSRSNALSDDLQTEPVPLSDTEQAQIKKLLEQTPP